MNLIGKVRIEVDKGNGHFFFTGKLFDEKGMYRIDTIKGERLIFRKDQVVQIDLIGDANESP